MSLRRRMDRLDGKRPPDEASPECGFVNGEPPDGYEVVWEDLPDDANLTANGKRGVRAEYCETCGACMALDCDIVLGDEQGRYER